MLFHLGGSAYGTAEINITKLVEVHEWFLFYPIVVSFLNKYQRKVSPF